MGYQDLSRESLANLTGNQSSMHSTGWACLDLLLADDPRFYAVFGEQAIPLIEAFDAAMRPAMPICTLGSAEEREWRSSVAAKVERPSHDLSHAPADPDSCACDVCHYVLGGRFWAQFWSAIMSDPPADLLEVRRAAATIRQSATTQDAWRAAQRAVLGHVIGVYGMS